jgi:hypothetical protein
MTNRVANSAAFAPQTPPRHVAGLDAHFQRRLGAVIAEGREIWDRFDLEVRQNDFHPFVPADYARVMQGLVALRGEQLRFLEWGSATGVITILADLLGYDAYGIELDPRLVEVARGLATRHGSAAKFQAGSLFPAGYDYHGAGGDHRTGTLGDGESAYLRLGRTLADFNVVYGYPWDGEEAVMHDLMRRHGAPGAWLMLPGGDEGVRIFRNGVEVRKLDALAC